MQIILCMFVTQANPNMLRFIFSSDADSLTNMGLA